MRRDVSIAGPRGSTATDDLAGSYYGLPVIKAPHWRWLVISYFVTGALAGGTYVISVIADLVGRDRELVRWGRYLSLAAALPSPILLALDLGRPDRAFNMFRIVKLRSPMSLGSWALLMVGVTAGLLGTLQAATDLLRRPIFPGVQRVTGMLGLPFALFLSGYTGLLLAITNVPVWARNSLLMGPTFLASAFSGSLSALSLALGLAGGEQPDTAKRLARAESICLISELALLLVGIARLGRLGRPLTRPPWGLLFWPVTVVGGIIVPLGLQLTGPARGKDVSTGRRVLTALLVLTGGAALRTAMIFAGRESARRPEDYFEMTRARP
jgi:formate-dependent nitrite reductase membrane component NrfD